MRGKYENGSERDQIGGVTWIDLMRLALFWDVTQSQSSYLFTLEFLGDLSPLCSMYTNKQQRFTSQNTTSIKDIYFI